MAQITELITKFSFEGSITPLQDFNNDLGKSIGITAAFVAGTLAAATAIGKFALDTFEALDPLVQLQRTTDVSIERMQELGFIASVSGSSLTAVTNTIEGLSRKIGEASIRGSEDFARLGINIRNASGEVKTADQVLDEVGQRFRTLNLSLAQQRSFSEALGIDPSLIQLLNRTGDEMNSLAGQARQLGVVTREQGDLLADVNDAFTIAGFAVDGIERRIALGLGPELKDLADGFTELLVENADWIEEGARAAIEIIGALIDSFQRLAPVFGVIVAGFAASRLAAFGFGNALKAAFSPVVLITAGITAALLVIDDLIVGLEGGQSVVADFFQEFFGIDILPTVRGIFNSISTLIDGIKALFTGDLQGALDLFTVGFMRIFDITQGLFEGFKSIVSNGLSEALGVDITPLIDAMFAPFELSITFIKAVLRDGIIGALESTFQSARDLVFNFVEFLKSSISNAASAAIDSVSDFFSFGDDDGEPQLTPQTPAQIELPQMPALPPMQEPEAIAPMMQQGALFGGRESMTQQVSNNQSINQQNTFNINGGNPMETSEAIENSLQRQLSNADEQFQQRINGV